MEKLTSIYQKWNDVLDYTVGCGVKKTSSYFSSPAKEYVCQQGYTQAKYVIYGLGSVVWLQLTIGNPLLSKIAGYILGPVGILSTLGLAFRYQKEHNIELKDRSLKVKAIVLGCPFVLSSLNIVLMKKLGFFGRAGCLYVHDLKFMVHFFHFFHHHLIR